MLDDVTGYRVDGNLARVPLRFDRHMLLAHLPSFDLRTTINYSVSTGTTVLRLQNTEMNELPVMYDQ